MRGKPVALGSPGAVIGSITACAGETPTGTQAGMGIGVYHRVCGGNPGTDIAYTGRPGLSPRVRGKRVCPACWHDYCRSITACAGETRIKVSASVRHTVYHRVCGGNLATRPPGTQAKGLSPRVRGKHTINLESLTIKGSITACAGETLQLSQIC